MHNYSSFSVNDIKSPSLLFIESTLLACFDNLKTSQLLNDYSSIENIIKSNNFHYLCDNYPVAAELVIINEQNSIQQSILISDQFYQNFSELATKKLIDVNFNTIKNIELGVGDFHQGLSTAFIYSTNGNKIVFKPTDCTITESYFIFLDWVNQYYSLGDYRYKIVKNNKYQWLEYVNHAASQCEEELQLYFERAGFMLGILYILNAVDYHYENVIAKGTTPVFIDHETIIQPKVCTKSIKYFKSYISQSIEDSVIATMLLPNHEESSVNLPIGTCGFGYHKQKNVQILKKEAVDRYTDHWRFVTKFAIESFQKQNIPTFDGKAIYPVSYLEEFLTGFEKSYQFFLNQRQFLLEDKDSPLSAFIDNTTRFIWRATNVYTRIHNYMKQPKNLVDYNQYEQKIHDFLAVAFKNVPVDSDLWLIHKHEVAQMLRGDIPFFEVNSSSRDLKTEYGAIKNFFEFNAIDNIKRKLKKLSSQDLEIQKNLIKTSLLS